MSAGELVRIGFVDLLNVYLLRTPRGAVLVDTGAPGMRRWLLRRLARLGLRPEELAAVVLTHFHVDHAGNVDLFLRAGVPVYAHPADRAILAGEAPHPGYGPGVGRWLERLEALLWRPKLPDIRELPTHEPLFDSPWRAVAAPGHTPGSVALWQPRTRDLLSGDTLVTTFGRPRGPVPIFTADLTAGRRAARRLLELGPRRVLPGHGPPVAPAAFRRRLPFATPAVAEDGSTVLAREGGS